MPCHGLIFYICSRLNLNRFCHIKRYDNLKGTPKYQYPKYEDEGMPSKYKYGGDKVRSR